MNVYQQARRHAWAMIGNVLFGCLFIVIVDRFFGHSTLAFAGVIVVLVVLNRRIMTFDCPRCGSNLFFRKYIMLPWPNRHCSRCGLDLAKGE